MTNYSKWDKFAADLASDTEEEEDQELQEFTRKSSRYIHIPPRDFSQKRKLCEMLEEDEDFEAPGTAAAGLPSEAGEDGLEPGVSGALKKYNWSSVGSQFVPGYGAASGDDDLWRLFFDDNFLSTQKEQNRGARALLGHASLGSFVVACMSRRTGKDRPISRKEVADLIMRRQQGGDAERINLEHEKNRESMKLFEKLGAETVELKGPDA